MKKVKLNLFKFVAILCSALFLTACPGKDDPDTLSVSPTVLVFAADELQEKSVAITTNVNDWDYDVSADWIVANKSGSALLLSVRDYTNTNSPRIGTVTVRAGKAQPISITVTQNAKEINSLSVNQTSLSFNASDTGEKTVAVSTNAPSWNASSDKDWVRLTPNNNNLLVRVASDNTATDPREATVTVTAGNAPPVTLKVTQAGNPEIVYNNAGGYYLGNALGTGTAAFTLELSNNTSSLDIWGFCELPSSFANFRLTSGTYSVSASGANRTFLTGSTLDSGEPGGTVLYNTGQHIFITGGTFTVSQSGSSYTITTNFTGRNSATGATVSNIRARYTGSIAFINGSTPTPPFGSFVKSNYSASGTPVQNNPGYNYTSWTGVIEPVVMSSGSQYYSVSKWAGSNTTVYLDYIGGRILLDNYSVVFENSTHRGYLLASTYNSSTNNYTLYTNLDYFVSYNNSTKTLDFSGTINGSSAIVGIFLKNKTTNAFEGYIANTYRNLKFTLTSNASAVASGSPVSRIAAAASRSQPKVSAKTASPALRSSDFILFKDMPGVNVIIDDSRIVVNGQ